MRHTVGGAQKLVTDSSDMCSINLIASKRS